MVITASDLRQNIYRLLDQVAETGIPIEINRRGKIVRLVSERKPGKLLNLKTRKVMNGDPESIVHLDWSSEWKK